MANVKLGDRVYEGVTEVKMTTPEGGFALFHEGGGDLSPIKEAVEALGGTVTSEDVEGLAQAVAQLETQIDPWEEITQDGEDALGAFHFVTSAPGPADVNKNAGYWRLKPGFRGKTSAPRYGQTFKAIDLSNLEIDIDEAVRGTLARSDLTGPCLRLVLPERFRMEANMIASAPRALYLPKHLWNSTNNAKWITRGDSNSGLLVKCPVGADIPYYLNTLTKLSAEDMVGIFQNMADRSGETEVATITLGSDNLAKLTEEQMDIARAKGWSLA